MASKHHALRLSKMRARDNRVAKTINTDSASTASTGSIKATQRSLNHIGNVRLMVRRRLDIDEFGGQGHGGVDKRKLHCADATWL